MVRNKSMESDLDKRASSTCGFTSRMQIFPVSITSCIELIFVPYRFPSYSPCSKNRPFLMSHSISLRVMKEYIWPSLSSSFGFLEVTGDKNKSKIQKQRLVTEHHFKLIPHHGTQWEFLSGKNVVHTNKFNSITLIWFSLFPQCKNRCQQIEKMIKCKEKTTKQRKRAKKTILLRKTTLKKCIKWLSLQQIL